MKSYLANYSLGMRTFFYGLVACEDLCTAESSDFDWILDGVLCPTHDFALLQEPSS